MNYSTAVFLINDDVRAVSCIYDPDNTGEKPTIFKTLDQDLKKGDFVIVPTDTRCKMTVVKVAEVDLDIDFDDRREVKWVVGRMDLAHYEDLKRQEADAIDAIKSAERKKKRDEMKNALLADHAEKMKTLEIAHSSGDKSEAKLAS